jgi:hypothetical protein
MGVVECEVPSDSLLSRELIERAYFVDAYRALLRRSDLGIVDIVFGIFAHHPCQTPIFSPAASNPSYRHGGFRTRSAPPGRQARRVCCG